MEMLLYFGWFVLGGFLASYMGSKDWKIPFLMTFAAFAGFVCAPLILSFNFTTIDLSQLVKEHTLIMSLFSFLLGGLLVSYVDVLRESIFKKVKQ